MTPASGLDIQRVGADRIVEIDGKPGLFTPLVGADPNDAPSSANLEQVVNILRQQVGRLQADNASLTARLVEQGSPARSPEDFASGIQHSLDVLQDGLGTMANAVTNFAVREFHLETKVHVDVTPLGTVGFHFVQPGEQVDAATLSTLSITVVPIPKESSDNPTPPANSNNNNLGIEAIDGLSSDQQSRLRAAHITTVGGFQRVATRATTTASLISLLEIDREALGRYTLLAGLLTVPGLDRASAANLYDAGITDVASLAAADPAALVRRYRDAAKRRGDDAGGRLTTDQAAQWIAAARQLVAPA